MQNSTGNYRQAVEDQLTQGSSTKTAEQPIPLPKLFHKPPFHSSPLWGGGGSWSKLFHNCWRTKKLTQQDNLVSIKLGSPRLSGKLTHGTIAECRIPVCVPVDSKTASGVTCKTKAAFQLMCVAFQIRGSCCTEPRDKMGICSLLAICFAVCSHSPCPS